MSTLKTLVNDASVDEFIAALADPQKRSDSQELLRIFKKVTGEPPKMWGPSIIGFGQYHYKSERSSQEGDWPLVAFSPRKQSLTLYVMPSFGNLNDLLAKLGKHKTSKGCLYVNRLADVDVQVLEKIVDRAFQDAKAHLLK